MLKGPQGQKRPADAIARAVMIGRLATGEEVEDVVPVERAKRGVAGAAARNEKLSPARKKEIAKAAAEAKWG